MANEEHLDILKQGVAVWNRWREENPNIQPDLSEEDLRGIDLFKANLQRVNFVDANLFEANLIWADLSSATLFRAMLRVADLSEANLSKANLSYSDLSEAKLIKTNLNMAILTGANLRKANLSGADLKEAKLINATLVETNFEYANLTGCEIYGISAWGINLKDANQSNLIITRHDEPIITVDNLEVAQFIYLLLNNEKVRDVINTITTKVVLILGRFTPERKVVLDAIREELRRHNYLPVLFDFEKPASRDLTETVRTLAHLARFIIADITEPRSIPQELQAIVPDLAVPVQPLLLEGSTGEYGTFQDLRKKYHWVLAVRSYKDLNHLLTSLNEIIASTEAKAKELEKR